MYRIPILLSTSHSCCCCSRNSTNLSEVVSATVLLNLAITVHLDAMERIQISSQESSSTCKNDKSEITNNSYNDNKEENENAEETASAEDQLRRAIRLYEFAHTVFLGLHETSDNDDDYVNEDQDAIVNDYVLVLCCIVNNLGHIHRILNEIDIADRYFEHLLSLLMYCMNGIGVGDYSSSTSSTTTITTTTTSTTTSHQARFLEQFLDNTVYLIHGGPTKSPAPAA